MDNRDFQDANDAVDENHGEAEEDCVVGGEHDLNNIEPVACGDDDVQQIKLEDSSNSSPTNSLQLEMSSGFQNQNSDHTESVVACDDENNNDNDENSVDEVQEIILKGTPTTLLEKSYHTELERKKNQVLRLSREVAKLKTFISKRKQTYKRKRKDEGAPTRALSAYNIFIRDRFSKLAKDNETALKSDDVDAQLKRVAPSSLVASTGNQWRELSPEEKQVFEKKAAMDRKRYQDQMADYQPPEKQKNRRRNKTGYNLFFSAHVDRLKQTEGGVPSERGSCARIVGNAWKNLSNEDKQYYEVEAGKQNAASPVVNKNEDSKAAPAKEKRISRGGEFHDSQAMVVGGRQQQHQHYDIMSHHHASNGTPMHQMTHGSPPQQQHTPHPMGLPSQGYHSSPPQHGVGGIHPSAVYHGYPPPPQQQHPTYHAQMHNPNSHVPPHYAQHLPNYH